MVKYVHSTMPDRSIELDRETEDQISNCNAACYQSIVDKLIEGYVLEKRTRKKGGGFEGQIVLLEPESVGLPIIKAECEQMKIGDKVVEVETGSNGVPIIKATSEEIRHPDGRVDVVIHVPCLKLQSKKE